MLTGENYGSFSTSGGAGGAGGKAIKTYTSSDIMPIQVTVVVGSGGSGGAGGHLDYEYGEGGTPSASAGSAGKNGSVTITWSEASDVGTTIIYLTSGSTWTVPSDWNNANNTIEAIGAGGTGPSGASPARGGGGGGAYAKAVNVSLESLTQVQYQIGAGGGTAGSGTGPTANTWFKDASTLVAAGGASGTTAGGGAGGSAANSVGAVVFSGGNGGFHNSSGYNLGGGGGGAAGQNGAGGSGGNGVYNSYPGGGGGANGGANGGTGSAGAGASGGGNGGLGRFSGLYPGGNGTNFDATHGSGGGGGGGALKAPAGGGLYGGGGGSGTAGTGLGAPGLLIITYTPGVATCSVSLTPSAVNRGSSSTLSWSAQNANISVYIENVGYVSGSSGSFSVAPNTTTDYSCYAQGSVGSDGWHEASLTVYQPCTWSGGSVQNGSSVTAYQSDSVPYGNSCLSQTRTCTNGTLSGTYAYASCAVSHQSCTLDGVTVEHGASDTFYSSQTAPIGQLCSTVSQSRTCTDGTFSGSASYRYASCTCAPIYSCSGNSITYTDSSCSTSTVLSCSTPYLCSPGQSACVSPDPEFNESDGRTGHLQAQPQIVPPGLTSRVYWDVSNVQSCTVTGANGDSWTGLSGEKTTSPILTLTAYTLSCTPLAGGSFPAEQVNVNVVPIFQEL
jgi:hypothetical protein